MQGCLKDKGRLAARIGRSDRAADQAAQNTAPAGSLLPEPNNVAPVQPQKHDRNCAKQICQEELVSPQCARQCVSLQMRDLCTSMKGNDPENEAGTAMMSVLTT